MFQVEYVIVAGRTEPGVVEKHASGAAHLAQADATARSLLDRVRQARPSTPPDGYQIRNNEGVIVLRSWERKFLAGCPETKDA